MAQKSAARTPEQCSSQAKKPKSMDSLSQLLRATDSPPPPPKTEKIKKYAFVRPPPAETETPLDQLDFSKGLEAVLPAPVPLYKFAEFKPTQPLANYESQARVFKIDNLF